MGLLKKGLEIIDESLFPSNIYCMICGSMIDSSRPYSICDSCSRKLHWNTGKVCEKCGRALPETYRGRRCYDCMSHEHVFTKGYSCFTYGFYEREMILGYKYNGRGYMGKKLGDILFDRIACENLPIDVIIPVPIHEKRQRERGYNQAEVMGGYLATRMKKPLGKNILLRSRHTAKLRSLSPVEREAELEGAFEIKAGRSREIEDKSILLIDDIYTTGTTADVCSKVLFAGGAGNVFILTLASGGNRRPEMPETSDIK